MNHFSFNQAFQRLQDFVAIQRIFSLGEPESVESKGKSPEVAKVNPHIPTPTQALWTCLYVALLMEMNERLLDHYL